MGLLVNLLVVSVLLFASRASSSWDVTSGMILDVNAELSRRHEQWMMRHGRVYCDENKNEKRFQIFKKNVAFIEAFNNADETMYKLAVNKFVDLTDEEFKATYTGCRMDKKPLGFVQSSLSSTRMSPKSPPSIDWRTKGAITRVKTQGNCQSYWAFSTTAAVEGITAITSGNLMELSSQELVDCVKDCGCHGGAVLYAIHYIMDNGLATERSYSRVLLPPHIRGYQQVPANGESALIQAVSHQPVSVSIDAQFLLI